jgi:hypothetical protein
MGAAGMVAARAGVQSVFAEANGWVDGMQINPDIDNLRVVFGKDEQMLASGSYGDWFSANTRVNAAKVKENLDIMAMALAQRDDITAAWQTIFRKPVAKEWSQVTAAIKVNTIGNYYPAKGVVGALCEGLKSAGVWAANITIYDATQGRCNALYSDVSAGVKTSQGGSTYNVVVGSAALPATTVVQNLDILISCAVCKQHDWNDWANFSMTLKNHVGTIKFSCPNEYPTQLTDLNKSEAIIGSPSAMVPAKQQLAIVDCLWASQNGGFEGNPNCDPRLMVMGTFAPAVDYMCSQKVRKAAPVNATVNDARAKSFLTDFGISAKDVNEMIQGEPSQDTLGRGWVDARTWEPAGVLHHRRAPILSSTVIEFKVKAAGFRPASTHILLNRGVIPPTISMYDTQGRLVRYLTPPIHVKSITWDGCTNAGCRVSSGTYLVVVRSGASMASEKIFVSR